MALETTFDLGYVGALLSLACTLVLSVCFASAQANLAFELQQLVPGLSLNGTLKRWPESLFQRNPFRWEVMGSMMQSRGELGTCQWFQNEGEHKQQEIPKRFVGAGRQGTIQMNLTDHDKETLL